MIGSRVLPLVLALLASAALAAEQLGQAPNPCERTDIHVALDPRSGVEVVGHQLEFEARISGALSLRNRTGHALRAITVIVNYLEADGSILYSIPYRAGVAQVVFTETDIYPFTVERLTKPIPQGGGVLLFGTNLLSTTAIPTRAEVSVLNLTFTDGSHRDSLFLSVPEQAHAGGSQAWNSDPLPIETPSEFRAEFGNEHPPDRIFVTVRVEPSGQPVVVAPREGLDPAPNAFPKIAEQLQEWRFFPAIENGHPIPSDLNLLLLFRPRGSPPARECPIRDSSKYPKTFAIVTLDPKPETPGRWLISYAGFPAHGKFQRNEVDDRGGTTKSDKPR